MSTVDAIQGIVGDRVIRWGGDEFAVLYEGTDVAQLAEQVRGAIESATAGRAVLNLPFRLKLSQGGGLLHGGALATLADTAVAMAIKSLLPVGTAFATTELSMQFVAPVQQGLVRAVAEVTGPNGRSFSGAAELFDANGKTVGRFSSTFRVARGQGFTD